MNQKIKIIYVEDNVDDIDLMGITLSNSSLKHELIPCHDLAHLEELLTTDNYNIIISDYNLPSFSGLDVTKLVRSKDKLVPIIIISGAVGEEKAVELIKNGASDFFLKERANEIPKEILKLLEATELKKSAEAHRENYERQSNILHTLIDSLQDFICLKDQDRRYIMVNRAMAEHYEVTSSEFIQNTTHIIEDKLNIEVSKQADNEVLNEGKIARYESDNIDKNGKRTVLETVKTPIFTKDEITGIVGVSRDITHKKVLEEEQKKNQTILNHAEIITKSASFQYDSSVDLITCSENFNRLLNNEEGSHQFPLKHLVSYVAPEDKVLFTQELENAVKRNQEFNLEFRYITNTDQKGYGRMQLNPDPASNQPIFFGIIVDITADRLNSIALDEAQEVERKKLSQELHDNISQKLTAAKIYLEHINSMEGIPDHAVKAQELIHDSIKDIRQISREMSTKQVSEVGLVESVNMLLANVPESLFTSFNSNIDDHTINNFVAGNILRVIQESINNTLKYAKAKSFSICMEEAYEIITLTLIDDGAGFDISSIKSKNGLINIEHRIKSCNGIVNIHSELGNGTTIKIKVPKN